VKRDRGGVHVPGHERIVTLDLEPYHNHGGCDGIITCAGTGESLRLAVGLK
jgi:hypothetical protein